MDQSAERTLQNPQWTLSMGESIPVLYSERPEAIWETKEQKKARKAGPEAVLRVAEIYTGILEKN